MTTIHYVEFDEPGMLFPETSARRVKTRIPASLMSIPKNTFALNYYDREEICHNKEKLLGDRKNRSPRILFGEAVDIAWLKRMNTIENGKYRILISNIKCNSDDGRTAVNCITGNWQALLKDDILLPDHDALKNLKEAL